MWAELLAAHQSGRVRAASVRASDFFGAGVEDSAYGDRFFGPLLSGGKAQVLGSPQARHSVTYVPDLARAAVHVAEDPSAWGRAWHAPTATAITQLALVEAAARAASVPPAYVAVKRWQLRLVGVFNPGARETVEMLYEFDHDFVVDSSAFETHFGQPPTPLADALAETAAWYRQAQP
jgi:nucleoside-diphosphate-sugar epimerase